MEEKVASGETLPYKFTSKELDPETGLYYFGHRYHDPRLGRWLSVDAALDKYLAPFEENQDTDSQQEIDNKTLKIRSRLMMYAYGMNSPIVYFDPDGNDDFYFTIKNSMGLLSYRDDNGKTLWTVPANSGIDKGLNNPSMQKEPNIGPIMENTYSIDLSNKAKPDRTQKDGLGWGRFGWRLKETFMGKLSRWFSSDRTGGFFLHQDMYKGNKKGTGGCIGVIGEKNILKVKNALEKYSKNNSDIEVKVDYSKSNVKKEK